MDVHTQNKALIAPLRAAMYDFDTAGVRAALASVCAPDVLFRFCHPFGDLTGVEAFYDAVYAGLFKAWPDLERRDIIVIAGPDEFGNNWVGAGGYYTGIFTTPWLDIPPTGHQVSMRFHEFYRIVDGKVVEVQALWDIPEVMMQANAWPMVPSLGREWHVPGPATQDGLVPGPYDAEAGAASCAHIIEMLEHLKKHPAQGGPEVMEMERFWHPRMNWYGPSGIGTGRGIAGFRNWHQIPFLNGMPDRGQYVDEINYHFFGDGDYAAVTGWPNMIQTVTHDGWMGIAPAGRKITMRSLDFWRLENGKIRENWVLVDLLDAYAQLGVDVFARLREFNKARNLAPINIPNGMS
ncbi:ester cyclase [Tritonibacter mobilis]|uniref:ester cyclase n=1 Tax=Tritonibacter mobilis TaxID=379347 RepID=UPI000806AE2A|nr:ester cyclase [Tritonibacter mobilis]